MKLVMTDHARIRYLQRVEGMDVLALDRKIITGDILEQVHIVGKTGKLSAKTHRITIENGVVITVTKGKKPPITGE